MEGHNKIQKPLSHLWGFLFIKKRIRVTYIHHDKPSNGFLIFTPFRQE